jgi:hypothetical protein
VDTKVLGPLRACVKVADCCDPSFTSTLICVKSLKMLVSALLPPYPNNSH